MGHSVTIGGERLGSGSKNKTYLHNYERSTHNLDTDFLSTMGCGMLIPFLNELVTRDDKYEIDLEAGLRTIPTKGPLFGSFKLQLDVFKCPLRLYQALLHNNPLAIGLKANQVKFPKIKLYDTINEGVTSIESKSANNSLIKYLGTSGIGTITSDGETEYYVDRLFFGADLLAYYDIFKNYYANKQEEYAYTLRTRLNPTTEAQRLIYINSRSWSAETGQTIDVWKTTLTTFAGGAGTKIENENYADTATKTNFYDISFRRENLEENGIDLTYEEFINYRIGIQTVNLETGTIGSVSSNTIKHWLEQGNIQNIFYDKLNTEADDGINIVIRFKAQQTTGNALYSVQWLNTMYHQENQVILENFKLENIDKMRYDILAFSQLGQTFIIDGDSGDGYAPYTSAIGDSDYHAWKNPLAGICVKTYQSDLFNNWVKTELIDGENGIADITAIATGSGSITIDQIQFSEKLYNLLNRIAISGNTYEDYLDAAYTKSHKRFEETPMWLGGMSDEIVFEEIVQTAPGGEGLGTLGGRGNLMGRRNGGKITVHIDEPSIIMGIVSITPRIVYTQGNTWFKTEIESLMDIHVPALDGIGFQNLMAEEMHSSAAIIDATTNELQQRAIVGKIPAWLHYMTNIDRAYGDFAAEDGDGFMVLNRNYEVEDGVLQDATTYIDPAKYNYAFAYTKREAQNFWVKIKARIKARRLMSAKQIPTA